MTGWQIGVEVLAAGVLVGVGVAVGVDVLAAGVLVGVGMAVGVGVLGAGVLVGVGVAVAVSSVKSVRADGRIVRLKPIGGWLK